MMSYDTQPPPSASPTVSYHGSSDDTPCTSCSGLASDAASRDDASGDPAPQQQPEADPPPPRSPRAMQPAAPRTHHHSGRLVHTFLNSINILFAPGLASPTPATALRIDNFVDSANSSSSTYVISLHREGRGFPLQLLVIAYNL
eukprot:COSAG01_NODE_6647_length_3564_cov_17.984132_2_plen_144_part_00